MSTYIKYALISSIIFILISCGTQKQCLNEEYLDYKNNIIEKTKELQSENLEEAIAFLEQHIKELSNDIRAVLLFYILYRDNREYDKAILVLKNYVDLNIDSNNKTKYTIALSALKYLITLYTDLEKYNLAKKTLLLYRDNLTDKDYLEFQAMLYVKSGRSYEFIKINKYTEIDGGTKILLIKDLLDFEEMSKFIRHWKEAEKNKHIALRAFVQIEISILYALRGDYDITEKILRDIAEYNKKTSEVDLGNVFYMKGNIEESITHYEKAIESGDYKNRYFLLLGLTYFQMKKYEKAEEHYKKQIDLDKYDGKAYLELIELYNETERKVEAEELTKKLLERSWNFHYEYYQLAKFYYDNFRFERCIYFIDKLLESNPNNLVYYYYKGKNYYLLGEKEKSKKIFEKALEIEPYNINTKYFIESLFD